MKTVTLSEAALALFRLHVERGGHLDVDDTTREPYRELARAGLMPALDTLIRRAMNPSIGLPRKGSSGSSSFCSE